MARALDIWVNEHPMGQVREHNDLWELEYAEAWLTRSGAFDLSPALSRQQRLHRDGGTQRPVQWYFDNLLPEEGVRTLMSNDADVDEADAFGLLAHFGSESAGALTLLPPDQTLPPDQGRRTLSDTELSHRIGRLPKVPITRDAPKRMSLAGAQHKLLVILDGEALHEPLGATPSTHLLKPNHPDASTYPASAVNEYFIMRLASRLRLDVPTVHCRWVPQPVFLIERFDRDSDRHQRQHIIDACQLLNRSRTFKYASATIENLNQIIAQCRGRAVARRALFRWLAFNVLVGNGDNHLKNLSFKVAPDGIELAPFYDLLSTAAYDTKAVADNDTQWPNTPLALPMPGAATFGDVRRSHLIAAGQALNLPKPAITRELDALLQAIRPAADRLADEIHAEAVSKTATCPDPAAARAQLPGALRVMRCITHLVISDMLRQLK